MVESDLELSERKLHYSMRVQIAPSRVAPNVGCKKALGSLGSDLSLMIRTDCICSEKCAEASCN